jgi:hypothetical protein
VTKDLVPWHPQANDLEKVKQYFLGFVHNKREIRPQRKHIAKKLGMKVRTVDRYLRHLKEIGWMETTKRTPRTAFRTVTAASFGGSSGGSFGGSFGGSQKKEDQEANSAKETREAQPSKQHHQRDDAACTPEEQEILDLAEMRRSAANLKALREFVSAGVPIEQIRGGVALGRLRHMSNLAAGPIASFRFFANPIAEAGEAYQPDQLEHSIRRLKRELSRRATGPRAETGAKVA